MRTELEHGDVEERPTVPRPELPPPLIALTNEDFERGWVGRRPSFRSLPPPPPPPPSSVRRNLSLALGGICCVLAGAIGVRLVGDRAQPTTVTPTMLAPPPANTAAPPPAETPVKSPSAPIVDSPAPTVQRALEKPALAEATPPPAPPPVAVAAITTPPVAAQPAVATQPVVAKPAVDKVTGQAAAAEPKPAAEKAPKIAVAKPAEKSGDDKPAAPAQAAAEPPAPIDHGVESAGF